MLLNFISVLYLDLLVVIVVVADFLTISFVMVSAIKYLHSVQEDASMVCKKHQHFKCKIEIDSGNKYLIDWTDWTAYHIEYDTMFWVNT